jgi:hypothetical protein
VARQSCDGGRRCAQGAIDASAELSETSLLKGRAVDARVAVMNRRNGAGGFAV